MPDIVTPRYTAKPSDSNKWVLIRSPAGKEVDVELRVLNYHYDCRGQTLNLSGQKVPCSRLCCYQGCYVSQKEIDFVTAHLEEVKKYLPADALRVLELCNDSIVVPDDYDEKEKVYKTRCAPREWTQEELCRDPDPQNPQVPENRCVFLMENGLCSVHKMCTDENIDWVKNKFNICVTFPLDLRPQDNTIAFMEGFDHFTMGNVDCICADEKKKMKLGMPQAVESMKYAIVDRYGEEFWTALKAFADDYRAGKIDINYIYKETESPKPQVKLAKPTEPVVKKKGKK